MTQQTFISRFSPQRTDPDVLERIFVQRQELLEQSVAVLRESALTANKHHLLFVGPRGCGKTHLLALIVHRLEKQSDLSERLRIAWLNEDETSTSLLDLLLRIYRALSERYGPEFPLQALDDLQGRDAAEALDVLRQMLLARIADRTVLVLIENLDMLFRQLEDSDQRAWRAFIQNHPVFATAATAQSLFAGVSDREQPFFGFFDTRHLQPLTVEEATQLLQRIAGLDGPDPLVQFLETGRGRARVQAIRHLSGGNHRLYIVLSDFITKDSLDELVRPFEEMVDEQLTPYYQERLRWLSPQQRKIVEFLCAQAGPVPVKRIAEGLFTEHSSIASQLQKLRDMGYVKPNPRGRESLYELAEPLMRLSMQVKNTRNHEPLRLIVDFLRVWFERDELERLSIRGAAIGPARPYLDAALENLKPGEPNLREELLRLGLDDLDIAHCTPEELENLRLLAEETANAIDWMNYAEGCFFHQQFMEATKCWTKIIELPGALVDQVSRALLNRGVTLGDLGRTQDEIADYTRLIDWPGAPPELVCRAVAYRGVALGQTGQSQDAIADHCRVIDLPGFPVDLVARALLYRGVLLGQMGQTKDEIADYSRVIALPGAPAGHVSRALVCRGITVGQMGRTQDEIADYTRAIDLPGATIEPVSRALFNRGVRLAQIGRVQESIADYTRVIEMTGAPVQDVSGALVNRGVALGQMERKQDAVADYSRVIESPGGPGDLVARALLYRGVMLAEMGRSQEELADYTRVIESPGAPAECVAQALVYRGFALGQIGRTQDAVADYTQVIDLPGALPRQVSLALLNRGSALEKRGLTLPAIADYSRVIELPGAPEDLISWALLIRGAVRGQIGRTQDAIADFTRLLDLPGAPAEHVARARGLHAGLLFASDAWIPALEQLRVVLAEKDIAENLIARTTDDLIASVFRQIPSPDVCRTRLTQTLALYSEHQVLPVLSEALVRHLAKLSQSHLNRAGLDQWLSGWETASAGHPPMQLALRLLRVGIAYLKSEPRSESVLLDLPREERSLVRQALGLPAEPE